MALVTEGTEACVRSYGALEVRAPVRDIHGAGRGWKLGLVDTLAKQESGRLDLDRRSDPMGAILRFKTQARDSCKTR